MSPSFRWPPLEPPAVELSGRVRKGRTFQSGLRTNQTERDGQQKTDAGRVKGEDEHRQTGRSQLSPHRMDSNAACKHQRHLVIFLGGGIFS